MRKDFLIDIKSLVALRRELHRFPELSGSETATAERIASFISRYSPDSIIEGMGGIGIAAIFKGREAGSSIMFRCELDALPIEETNEFDYKSEYENISHKCGHDGHMAIVSGLASLLAHKRPRRGSVILLFQSAEETGKGADRTINDGRFREIEPDYIFGLHNLPGFAHFTGHYKGGLFGLGAGINHPQLHSPDYDFPDRLIESGIRIFYSIYNNILNSGYEAL